GAVVLAWMMWRPIEVKPLIVSKINTFTQIALAGLILAKLGLGLGLDGLVSFLIWVTGALTVYSALAYFIGWLAHMMSYEEEPSGSHAHSSNDAARTKASASRASRTRVETT
ncbi:MAG: hypothetical protein AAF405_08440, partial [Pseudomonadota bacterium]